MRTVGENRRNRPWLGVTICNEAYRSRAEIAAEQFVGATDCPAVILEEQDFDDARSLVRSVLTGDIAAHEVPQAAKLFVFDWLSAERLAYFDADLLFIKPLDLSQLPGCGKLRVVRDFWWNDGVSADCMHSAIDAQRYFNSGLMLMERRQHSKWLEEARRIYVTLNAPVFREQTALNVAAQRLSTPTHYLPRDFNLIYGADTEELDLFSVTGLHLLHWFPPEDYRRMIHAHANTGMVCVDPATTRLAGEWIYERVGIGQRRLEFLPDGSIGNGSEACERFWRVWHQDGETILGVFGHAPGDTHIMLTFKATARGSAWHGRWLRFEQNAVLLHRVPHRRSHSTE